MVTDQLHACTSIGRLLPPKVTARWHWRAHTCSTAQPKPTPSACFEIRAAWASELAGPRNQRLAGSSTWTARGKFWWQTHPCYRSLFFFFEEHEIDSKLTPPILTHAACFLHDASIFRDIQSLTECEHVLSHCSRFLALPILGTLDQHFLPHMLVTLNPNIFSREASINCSIHISTTFLSHCAC